MKILLIIFFLFIANCSNNKVVNKHGASALELKLNQDDSSSKYKCFIVMRCWHPRAQNVVKYVINYNPNEVIVLRCSERIQ